MKFLPAFSLAFLIFHIVSSYAQTTTKDQDTALENALKANRKYFSFENRIATGEGYQYLLSEANKSNFFLLGEHHNTVEIPEFTTTLFKDINLLGYQTLCYESGPVIAEMLCELYGKNGTPADERIFWNHYPYAIPFANASEEIDLIQTVVKFSKNPLPIWGLDQEFIFAGNFLVDRLAKYAGGRDAFLNRFAKQIDKRYNNILISKTIKAIGIDSLFTDDEFKALRKHINTLPYNSKARLVFAELVRSKLIYEFNDSGDYYANNTDRFALMKEHFYLNWTKMNSEVKGPQQKILFKLGSMHMTRDKDFNGFLDLGTFIGQFSEAAKLKSFHVAIYPKSGFDTDYLPATNEENYSAHLDTGKIENNQYPPLFVSLASDQQWTVFDLRQIRLDYYNSKLKINDKDLRDLVKSFDAIIVFPKSTSPTFYPLRLGLKQPKIIN